jgi:hypothetical protein
LQLPRARRFSWKMLSPTEEEAAGIMEEEEDIMVVVVAVEDIRSVEAAVVITEAAWPGPEVEEVEHIRRLIVRAEGAGAAILRSIGQAAVGVDSIHHLTAR